MTIEHIAAIIKRCRAETTPILIGVEGNGGSGKTTLAQALAAALCNAYVISMDDFIVKEKLTEPSWDNGAFDRKRLEQQVLLPATRGQPIEYQRRIWDENILSDPITVPKVEYLIVEGISSYHPSIEQYYDFKIWIETPIEIAQRRGHARDGSNENAPYWDLWAKNDAAHQLQYHPEQRADFIVINALSASD